MPDITLKAIVAKLAERLSQDDAEAHLALALQNLDLPVKDAYTPGEVMAIGTEIANSQREVLAKAELADARILEGSIAPLLDALSAEHPERLSAIEEA